jgi:geranylgeranyl diphosphate synthase type II
MNDYKLRYEKYLAKFEDYALKYMEQIHTRPAVLGDSMRYSLLSGGKRIRPVLALACAEVLELEDEVILPYALALEMLHTYSLIHDDLPAMDNDDFRRGKPTNHKIFGEANAILAGDALLNESYAICLEQAMKGEKYALAAKFLNECAGIYGMLAGQSADLYHTEKAQEISEEELFYVDEHKTGKLIIAPISMASILSGHKYYIEFEHFGKLLGRLFQMTDDILDVTGDFDLMGKNVGKDEGKNKLTCVRVYGLEGAKIRADMCAKDCHAILEGVDGDTSFLHNLVDYVLNRKN